MALHFDSPLGQVKGVGPAYQETLRKRGITSVLDLLLCFPDDYLDLSRLASSIRPGVFCPYLVELPGNARKRYLGWRKSILRVPGAIGDQKIDIVFFNRPYLQENLLQNDKTIIFGRIEERLGHFQMVNPKLFPADTKDLVIPLYPSIGPIAGGTLKRIIRNALAEIDWTDEVIPAHIREKYGFPPLETAMATLHGLRPAGAATLARLKKTFVYLEFLFFHLELQSARQQLRQRSRQNIFRITESLCRSARESLPFKLTKDQDLALAEILADLQKKHPMARLLQGEVGSGKTAVSFLAIAVTLANSMQAAFLAPTAILADQQYANALNFFSGRRLALLTGATPTRERKLILEKLAGGDLDLVFGTHALLGDRVVFKHLGLVVIDEQHRFGVAQRAALHCKGKSVDLLVMSATPIPRTLALTLYQDLDLSSSMRPPAGRPGVKTRIVKRAERAVFYKWLRAETRKGRCGFIVLPLVEKSMQMPRLLAVNEDGEAIRSYFGASVCAVISGATPASEKERAMEAFRRGKIQLLISTSVIEVGLDLPQASFMVIENAERFGLSQLHQLRGRIGRGTLPGTCFLLPSAKLSEKSQCRLQTIAATNDGLKIAETDLAMRGGGTVIGQRQSGHFGFRLGDPGNDFTLFQEASLDAARLSSGEASACRIINAHLASRTKLLTNISFS